MTDSGPDYISMAIPFFLLGIFLEAGICYARKKKYYRLNDAFNSLTCGIVQAISVAYTKSLTFYPYCWVYEVRLAIPFWPHKRASSSARLWDQPNGGACLFVCVCVRVCA